MRMRNAVSGAYGWASGALVLLACALALLCAPARAWAYARVDVDRTCTLSVVVADDQAVVPNARLALYRIGDMTDAARLSLSGDFASYPVSIDDLDASGWRAAAQTLAAYAARDSLAPIAEGTSDASGRVDFGELAVGLYLITAAPLDDGTYTYEFEPAIVTMPLSDDAAPGGWAYDAEVVLKFERTLIPTDEIQVQKVWDDADSSSRPESVTVQLLCDGAVYDEVMLTGESGWRHEWSGLETGHAWAVVEKDVPSGYDVSVSREGTLLVVTNALEGEPPSEPAPETGEAPSYAPIVALVGIVILGGGWFLYRRSRSGR